ncbi:MAG: hypothetical protein G01um101448_494 [Parcubacteria group bacterium Gr01-1014_48]|nr:MAG: hypothetical protein Greene041614_813 [Parcubacteria group bacterium Greene0416_14]TSC73851.1 MAG: hypothetical protein G01um101448_494 [Parcubacteria group bacterium Gr01-1014_48]TSD00404.1 MAG: hypothetical protein Greene101415_862 [Parcubacteria group bacterium Greene1014_15]TSD07531.1 MAG: hypothetical protein Greene07144_873 [Parcubacteria group bacterium Greene0714_4]
MVVIFPFPYLVKTKAPCLVFRNRFTGIKGRIDRMRSDARQRPAKKLTPGGLKYMSPRDKPTG